MSCRVVGICGLLYFVIGCGSVSVKKDEKKVHNPPFSSGREFAANYFLDDLACQEEGSTTDISEAQVFSFVESKAESVRLSFVDVTSDQTLTGALVSGTTFGFHQIENCWIEDGEEKCDDLAEVVTSARDLKICRSGAAFDRNSVEGVTLSGMYGLETAFQYYGGVAGKKDMARAQLLVLPKVERQLTHAGKTETSYLTDNLAYAPTYRNKPTFIIFPKSKAAVARGLWVSVNLWEVPWAMAHEFSHHVFRNHTGRTRLSTFADMPIHSFPKEVVEGKGEKGFALTTTVAPNDEGDVWGALNEGFADLFAAYALQERKDLVAGLDCFAATRDVGSSIFANGRAKVLDAEAKRIFFSSSKVSTEDCSEPNFQDIHIIGAIFAHGIDQVLQVSGLANGEKAALLLKWSEALGLAANKGRDFSFGNAVSTLVEVMELQGITLGSEQCRVLGRVFSGETASFSAKCT